MRRIYLIARREYLAFVTAWGFWASLVILPFFIGLSVIVPAVAERAAPTRYYAVIAADPALEAAFEQGLDRGRIDIAEGAVRAAAQIRGADEQTERRAVEALRVAPDVDSGVAAAVRELGLPSQAAIELPQSKLQRIDPPVDTAEGLRPYLAGDAEIDTPEGPRPLYAAVFLRRAADGTAEVDYWSAALNDRTLRDIAERSMRELMREEALAAAGVPMEAVERANAQAPRVVEFNPARSGESAEVTLADRMPFMVSMGLGFALWIVIFSVVNVLLTGVIEEKGAKILEALLSSARYHEILIGKLLGVAAVSATLLAVWGLFAAAGLISAARSGAPLPMEALQTLLDPGLLLPFVGYFVLGYLMYGAIFLAVGSLCETIQEAQTLMTPMIFVLMAPMLMLPVIIRAPDAPLVTVMSWVPLYTPFLMMMRLYSEPPLYEVIGTTLLLIVTTVAILWGAGGVFRAGVIGRASPESVKRFFGKLARRGG
jgi:ABC-2 type transport system permease protein